MNPSANPAPAPTPIDELRDHLAALDLNTGMLAELVEKAQATLAAKDAEMARRKAQLDMWTSAAMDGNAAIAQLTARAEKAEAELTTLNAERAETRDIRREMIRAQDEATQLRAEVENIKAWANSKADEAQELRAELDACREVKERVAELTDYVSSQPWSRAGAYSTRSAIEHIKETEAALAAAKEDAERLEFLAVNAAEVRVEWDDGEGPIPPEFSIVEKGTGAIGRGPTLRAAIDAASKT